MRQVKTALMTVVCGIALAAMPLSLTFDGFGSEQALAAKGGGSNGGGKGGSNGGGKGGSGGKSSGKSGSNGKSASAAGQTKASVSKTDKKSAKAAAKQQQVAAIAKDEKVAKEKNLNTKLGRLNSLKRNINAYINSKSKKFAAIQAFVTASAQSQIAQAALDKANAALATEQTELSELSTELDTLNNMTDEEIAALTPEQQTARTERIAALPGLITEQEAVVTAAGQDVTDAAAAAAAAPAPTADDLETALNEMANKPVDQEVIDWATDVLDGKVTEMRETLAAAAAEEAAAAPETEAPETETPETETPEIVETTP
jgi:hypothetical protein